MITKNIKCNTCKKFQINLKKCSCVDNLISEINNLIKTLETKSVPSGYVVIDPIIAAGGSKCSTIELKPNNSTISGSFSTTLSGIRW